ncbi:hypothetical protein CFC21_062964 [Triticum aestivum]|uniref:DUF1618 domain-containing protein n=2 Tax=Triticum aestivum TaxID=4565 RepID=A0A3B6JLR8_WHEAT|nr:hypothetical protein CFC21_062964 [Triticum aestivum]
MSMPFRLPAASFRPPTLQEPSYAADSASRRPGSPDWVLLQQLSYISDRRNATTAESKTSDGQAVALSFWLVDPPGVSYFTVHCPGLKEDDDDDHSYTHYEASVICAEGALVLFSVTLSSAWNSRYEYFVYRAGPGKPSLDLLPDPNIRGFVAEEFGLLPCGDAHGGHYAVAYLNWVPNAGDDPWQFDAHVFSSETRAWTARRASQSLSESDKLLLGDHDTGKQITVGAGSLGWVDIIRGILLVANLFDEHPVIQYIPLPEPRVRTTDEDGGIFYCADLPEYIRDVTCCDGLIKLVDIDFYGGDGGSDEGWIATTFTRMVSWDDWRRSFTVDAADISVDPSYRALLPDLWNDKAKQLDLKKLAYYGPTLSTQDDDFVYMMARVNDEDDKACVIAVDMKRAAVEAVAPFSDQGRRGITTYSMRLPQVHRHDDGRQTGDSSFFHMWLLRNSMPPALGFSAG